MVENELFLKTVKGEKRKKLTFSGLKIPEKNDDNNQKNQEIKAGKLSS